MTRYPLMCLLLGSVSWGQATTSGSAQAAQIPGAPDTTFHDATGDQSRTASDALDTPLITIGGFCNNPADEKGAAVSDCKTVITRGQFERVIDAIQPGMSKHARREFALHYAEALVMARKAEQMGLDRGPNYQEQMELARIQVLSQDLRRSIQQGTSQVSDRDIEDYYTNNLARFERAEMDRIYIPRARKLVPVSGEKAIDAEMELREREAEKTMKKEADRVRIRAVAGEEFSILQAYAYEVAGIKSAPPSTSMVIRRISLPPNQISVMDLKPGEISSVFTDPNGYFIYQIKNKNVLPLNQVRDEITATLRSQHMEQQMRAIHESANPTLDESYFAPRALPRSNVAPDDPPSR